MQNRILESLFDQKILKIIKLFLLNKEKQFYLQEITKQTNVPIATTFRIIKKLKNLEIIKENKIRRFKLYQCETNDKITFLESFLKEGQRILDLFVNKAKSLDNVEEIILYGKESEKKANILLIGKNIDSGSLKQLAAEFREKYEFTITYLCIEMEQFQQMSAMGLYSGSKKTLFRK